MESHKEEDVFFQQIQTILHGRTPSILGEQGYRKMAVLIPLIQTENGLEILFEKRAKTLRSQAGEICFPGGHIELTDRNPLAAAIRETSEELNIPTNSIQHVGDLDILLTHSQLLIYPYVGLLKQPYPSNPNPAEVDHLFSIGLSRLQNMQPERYNITTSVQPEENFPFHLIPNGKQYSWRTGKITQLFYRVDSYVIWGLTARILAHFLEILNSSSNNKISTR